MPARFLSGAEFARLNGWPSEIADDDLIAYLTLTGEDRDWLTWGKGFESR